MKTQLIKGTKMNDDETAIFKIREALKGEEKEIFNRIVQKAVESQAHDFLKKFVDQYETDSSFDNMLVCVCSQVLKDTAIAFMKEFKDKNNQVEARKAIYIISKTLSKISKELENDNRIMSLV